MTSLFPPVEDEFLQNNPQFAALYSTLTTSLLNPDGTTNDQGVQAKNDALKEALHHHRTRAAKSQIICSALCSMDTSAAPPSSPPPAPNQDSPPFPPPPELPELIALLSLQLRPGPALPPSTQRLLVSSPLYASLPTHLPHISLLVSAHLQTQALLLSRVFHPTVAADHHHPARAAHPAPPAPPRRDEAVRAQRAALSAGRHRVAALRRGALAATLRLLDGHGAAALLAVQHLERVKHGVCARSQRAAAELLAARARVAELETRVAALRAERAVYGDDVDDNGDGSGNYNRGGGSGGGSGGGGGGATREALAAYVAHLRAERARLLERERAAGRELWGYGVGRGEGDDGRKVLVMREIARVYGEVLREMKEIAADIKRLKGR